jgi:predicted MPP superfamily phosphohydrolase
VLTRRQVLLAATAGVTTAIVGTGGYAFEIEPHWVELVRRAMPLEHLPPELAGRTLLQISDLHVGPVSSDYLIRTLESARVLEPDFVAITGDFVSLRNREQYQELERVLSHLPLGRLGTVAALGNHDYGPAWSSLDVADEISRIATDAGALVLRNEARTVGGIQFAGTGDYWSPEFGSPRGDRPHGLFTPKVDSPRLDSSSGEARSAVGALVSGRPTIGLCHNPDAQDEPIWNGVRGWVLAGHTHGGQVKPPFLPPPVLPVRNRRYTAGVFDVGPGRTLYINRGLGHLTKVRFNVRPELTLFTLTTS